MFLLEFPILMLSKLPGGAKETLDMPLEEHLRKDGA